MLYDDLHLKSIEPLACALCKLLRTSQNVSQRGNVCRLYRFMNE